MKTCEDCKKPVSEQEWDIHTCSVQHCEAGPKFCSVCHKESKPTYGSEEVRKLREVIESQAEIIAELEQPTPVLETHCCQSCGAVIGSYPADYEEMECLNLECHSCGSKHGNTGCPAPDLAKQAIETLAEIGWKWDFATAEFVAEQPTPVQSTQQQEPYGYVSTHTNGQMYFNKTFQGVYRDTATEVVVVYTSPQPAQRTWVGLTHEDKQHLNEVLNLQGRFPIIDAIEAKLMGKNT